MPGPPWSTCAPLQAQEGRRARRKKLSNTAGQGQAGQQAVVAAAAAAAAHKTAISATLKPATEPLTRRPQLGVGQHPHTVIQLQPVGQSALLRQNEGQGRSRESEHGVREAWPVVVAHRAAHLK